MPEELAKDCRHHSMPCIPMLFVLDAVAMRITVDLANISS